MVAVHHNVSVGDLIRVKEEGERGRGGKEWRGKEREGEGRKQGRQKGRGKVDGLLPQLYYCTGTSAAIWLVHIRFGLKSVWEQ